MDEYSDTTEHFENLPFALTEECPRLTAMMHQVSFASKNSDSTFLESSSSSDDSLAQPSSQLLDAAASLLRPGDSIVGSTINMKSIDDIQRDPFQQSTLDTIPETASRIPQTILEHPPASPTHLLYDPSQTIVPAVASQCEERRMASLAGATAQRTGNQSFEIRVHANASAVDVLDVLGDPDFLPHWCDAVPSLIVTKCSEGTSTPSSESRTYEGGWIEATTSQLIAPRHTSCLYRTARILSNMLGFPEYGRVTMFVERHRGRVGLTIGPFPGDLFVSQTIRVETRGNLVEITNSCFLKRENHSEGGALLDTVENFLLPRLEDYMDQVLSSMARLRFVAERGIPARQNDEATTPLLVTC